MGVASSIPIAGSAPAAGAAADQVAGATIGAVLVTLAFVWLLGRHRAGGAPRLRAAAAWASRDTGLPEWAALPGMMLGLSLLVAVIGMYWDISLHIDEGRDPGPLANPAHYFILVGLFGVLFSGVLGAALSGDERPCPTAVRLPNGWWAPAGAVMITTCACVSLIAFPLDDLWHRMFGQDVTLWGPTHLLLIGGAALTIFGHWVLQAEAERVKAARRTGPPRELPLKVRLILRWRDWGLSGGLLGAFCAFQAEFDFGVPQFRLVWQPLLLALAASVCLVASRLRTGRGGALGAVFFFMVLRGLLSLLVGPVLGHTTPHVPIFVAEAVIVELLALRLAGRPIRFGLIAGALIGTVGFAVQYLLSAFDYVPWPQSLLAEGLVCAAAAGTAGGVLGGAVGRAVARPDGSDPFAERVPRWAVPAAGIALAAVMVWAVPMPQVSPTVRAQVALTDVAGHGSERWVTVTAKLDPPTAADGARWFTATAWQGGGSVVAPMRKVAEGVYRSANPVPASGSDWKSMLRLQTGRSISAMPIYLPDDRAIPAPLVAAPPSFSRPFIPDAKAFQREQKSDVPAWMKATGYSVVLAIWLTMIGIVCWGLGRVAGPTVAPPSSGESRLSTSREGGLGATPA